MQSYRNILNLSWLRLSLFDEGGLRKTQKTVIPARSECVIQGVSEVSGRFRYAVTDFPSQVSQKGVLVAATLVDFRKEAIPVRVLNLDSKLKTVDKGAVIATCEPVVDIVARPRQFFKSLRLPSILENLEGLNEEQRTAVRVLLQLFQNLFSTSDSDVGRCNMIQHRINTGNHPPIKQYPRRLPLAKKEEAKRLVKEMVDKGILEDQDLGLRLLYLLRRKMERHVSVLTTGS
ncbi:hypothetical protein AVEN_49297-1 [Araneus ventricosus]|uniref:Uncharacterized protein n=1 Tax=Araneus ventricosus TaxID=182803 RepID=A0A4Y2KRL6_ARAVE|nr:hypothetical protein AVEN_49297-1 [Araneus ventricosus]